MITLNKSSSYSYYDKVTAIISFSIVGGAWWYRYTAGPEPDLVNENKGVCLSDSAS